jgi:hypothetical protein
MTAQPDSGRATLTLAVLRHGGDWKVFGPSGAWRGFDYRVDAEEAALRLATQVTGAASEVEVLVQEPYGRLRPLGAV